MDVSIFIANKKRFWGWILGPLLLRFIAVSAVFGVTSEALVQCENERAAAELIDTAQRECDETKVLLERYEADPRFPVNEQLYQRIAAKNSEYGFDLTADVDSKGSKGVVIYEMDLSGELPTVYDLSAYLGDLMSDPLLVLNNCRVSFSDEVELDCSFEKLAVVKVGEGRR